MNVMLRIPKRLLVSSAFCSIIFTVGASAAATDETPDFVTTAPMLSANTAGGVVQITTLPLTAIRVISRFEVTTPSLTASTQGTRVEVTTPVLSAFVSSKVSPLPEGIGERACIGLYSCYNKLDIRNAMKEVSNYSNRGGAGFCAEVKNWLGRAECESAESRNAVNDQVGFPYSKELINCPPLDSYITDLRSRFAAGQETQREEEQLAAAFQATQMLLLSGRGEAFCKAIMGEINSGSETAPPAAKPEFQQG